VRVVAKERTGEKLPAMELMYYVIALGLHADRVLESSQALLARVTFPRLEVVPEEAAEPQER
jgi:hypothetical protein